MIRSWLWATVLFLLVGAPGHAQEPRRGGGECRERCEERPPCRLRFHAVSPTNPCQVNPVGRRGRLVLEDTATGEKWTFKLGKDGRKPAALEALVASLEERSWCVTD